MDLSSTHATMGVVDEAPPLGAIMADGRPEAAREEKGVSRGCW